MSRLTVNQGSEAVAAISGVRQFSIDRLPSVWSFDTRTEWTIEALVPAGAITLLTGDSGVGKSTLALLMAGAVSHGAPFLGLETTQKRALYVDGENPVCVVRERLDRLQIAETSTLDVWGGGMSRHLNLLHLPASSNGRVSTRG